MKLLTNLLTKGLAFIFFLGLSNGVIAQSKTKSKPNIVFFLVDDLGWADVAPNNSKTFYETPNISKLAKEGMRFTNAYAACPVCSPTRASIMTGKYPAGMRTTDWFGAPQPEEEAKKQNYTRLFLPAPYLENLPLEEKTIAETLKENGYKTFFAGKWHLGETPEFWPEFQGFDINKGGYNAGGPGKGGYFSPYNNPRLDAGPAGEYLPMRLAAETNKFIEDNKDQPFFAYFSFYNVHNPPGTTPELKEKYSAKKEKLGLTDKFSKEGDIKVRINQSEPTYAGMVEAVDIAVGRVVDKLKELGLEDNTIIVFFSDNGGLAINEGMPTSNLPLRAGKGWMYEGGIREPLIIKYPNSVKPNTINNTPVISNDFYATFLDAAGIAKHKTQGVSLMPLLMEKEIKQRSLFWHYPHYGNQGGSPASAIRDGDYKLIHWYENDRYELFNLKDDIGEQSNLISTEIKKTIKLKSKLVKWLKDQDASFPTKNPNANI
jgi:arylsulfatase A-like enzyme